MISFAALSRLQVHDKFLQIDIPCSSAHDIVWDCKSAFSVNFFNPIWPTKMAKMTVKINICVKQKNKTLFRVDFELLMTNMAIFSKSVALLPNKITEKKR